MASAPNSYSDFLELPELWWLVRDLKNYPGQLFRNLNIFTVFTKSLKKITI